MVVFICIVIYLILALVAEAIFYYAGLFKYDNDEAVVCAFCGVLFPLTLLVLLIYVILKFPIILVDKFKRRH